MITNTVAPFSVACTTHLPSTLACVLRSDGKTQQTPYNSTLSLRIDPPNTIGMEKINGELLCDLVLSQNPLKQSCDPFAIHFIDGYAQFNFPELPAGVLSNEPSFVFCLGQEISLPVSFGHQWKTDSEGRAFVPANDPEAPLTIRAEYNQLNFLTQRSEGHVLPPQRSSLMPQLSATTSLISSGSTTMNQVNFQLRISDLQVGTYGLVLKPTENEIQGISSSSQAVLVEPIVPIDAFQETFRLGSFPYVNCTVDIGGLIFSSIFNIDESRIEFFDRNANDGQLTERSFKAMKGESVVVECPDLTVLRTSNSPPYLTVWSYKPENHLDEDYFESMSLVRVKEQTEQILEESNSSFSARLKIEQFIYLAVGCFTAAWFLM